MPKEKDEFISFVVEQENQSIDDLMGIIASLHQNVKQLEGKLHTEKLITASLRETIQNQVVEQNQMFREIVGMYGTPAHTYEFKSLEEFTDFIKEEHSSIVKQFVGKVARLELDVTRLEELLKRLGE